MDREAFIREYKTDPYTAMIAKIVAGAWADGYEACRGDGEKINEELGGHLGHQYVLDKLRQASHVDLVRRALEEIADQRQSAEVQAILAMSAIGRLKDET